MEEQDNLTYAQRQAVNHDKSDLIISAGAGSGKTKTLIRRITDKIISYADITKMLIVTFTKASVADLKTKIFKAVSNALAKDPTNKALAND